MSAPHLVLAALVVVVAAWIGLSVWEVAARARLDQTTPQIRAAFEAHAAPYTARGDLPPPAYWDFRRGRLVEYPPGSAEQVQSEDPEAPFVVATVVREDTATGERWPLWMWGLWVGAVPGVLFHGLFGVAAVGLLAWWLRLRTDAG
ncbi:hypothetical protein [Rubrivirga sp. IMCC45206]|uniref:hypothetical protein n=1 Tax=Rubrivirga sp. IMCC45206 TaxID=3391614 RepID=UPI00398FB84F